MDFNTYIKKFETEVVLSGVEAGVFTKEENVSLRPGKLSAKTFGKTMGQVIDTDEVLVIDYYGFQRKSRGFFNRVAALQRHLKDRQVKSIKAPIVHFGSVKIETLAKLTDDFEILGGFPKFKDWVVQLRWGGASQKRRKYA